MKKLSYSSSGVSINKGNEFVSKISNLIKKDKGLIKAEIGGFSGQFPLSTKIKKPILVGATDGVGTKIQIAEEMNDHRTIGIDLVAMCVNDLIVDKATPLFFLDYISTGKLNVSKGVDIIKGIIKGCKISHICFFNDTLSYAIMVSQINKQDITMISLTINPSSEYDVFIFIAFL